MLTTVKLLLLMAMMMMMSSLVQSSANPDQHFKFRRRKGKGESKDFVVLSLMFDPERDGRSVLHSGKEEKSSINTNHHSPDSTSLDSYTRNPSTNDSTFIMPSIKGGIISQFLQSNSAQSSGDDDGMFSSVAHQIRPRGVSSLVDREIVSHLKLSNLEVAESYPSILSRRKKKKLKKRFERKRRKEMRMRRRREKKRERMKNKSGGGKRRKNNLKKRVKLSGEEACQFRMVKKCAKKLGILPPKELGAASDIKKCDARRLFLDCIEDRRQRLNCHSRSVARGNLPTLRRRLRRAFQTPTSCLVNEAIQG